MRASWISSSLPNLPTPLCPTRPNDLCLSLMGQQAEVFLPLEDRREALKVA